MAPSRRIRRASRGGTQSRDWFARTPDNNIRVNDPDGYLHQFEPVGWNGDPLRPGGWWVGSDTDKYAGYGYGPIGPGPQAWQPSNFPSEGSKLTEPTNRFIEGGPGAFLPAVTRCVTILCEAVVRTLWNYRNPRSEVFPRPLFVNDPMLVGGTPGPNGPIWPLHMRLTGHEFYSTLLADAILYGMGAFIYIEAADRTPLPGSLLLLNPFMVGHADNGGVRIGLGTREPFDTDPDGYFTLKGVTWRVVCLHGQYPNHEGWPQGVLLKHWPTFNIGVRLHGYIENLFTGMGIPSGYLSVTTPNFGVMVDDPDHPGQKVPEQDLLKRKWMQSHGMTGRREVAVLNSAVSYTPISLNPVDSEAAKMTSISRTDIAHAFGMSSVWLDEGMSGLNYSNSSERRADLVSMTAAGWGEKLTNLISSLLPFGSDVSVNWTSFIAPSTETLMPALVSAVQTGIITAGEARQYLGVVPWSGADSAWADISPAGGGGGSTPKSVAETVQKVYLGVGKVLNTDEARAIIRDAGADIDPSVAVEQLSAAPPAVQPSQDESED